MTNFEIKHDDDEDKFILDVTEIGHIFVTEDETCAEIEVTRADIIRLATAIGMIRKRE